jgi:hypothetical protein
MFDELQRLHDEPALCRILGHYAELGNLDREAWQDRLMELDGASGRELIQWHGELLAHGWIEQNTGHTPVLRSGSVAACYRITPAGRRALREAAEHLPQQA